MQIIKTNFQNVLPKFNRGFDPQELVNEVEHHFKGLKTENKFGHGQGRHRGDFKDKAKNS